MDTQLEHKAKKENSEVIKVLVEMKNDMAGMKNDMTGIKRRQDQVFQKQDIIHSTLAGEIPREHNSSSSGFHSFLSPSDVGFHAFRSPSEPRGFRPFRSPSATPSFCSPSATPSLVAWSPPFPQFQPRMSSLPQTGHQGYLGAYAPPDSSLLGPSIADPSIADPSIAGSSIPDTVLTDEDVQSLFSYEKGDMGGETTMENASQMGAASTWHQTENQSSSLMASLLGGDPLSSNLSVQLGGDPLPSDLRVQSGGNPLHALDIPPPTSGIPPPTSGRTSLPLSPAPSLFVTSTSNPLPHAPQLDFVDPHPPSQMTAGVSSGVRSGVGLLSSSPAVESQDPIPSSVSTPEEHCQLPTFPRARPVGDVIKAFLLKNKNTLDINNVGKLGIGLARYSFFGDEVLKISSLKGKGSRPGLDPKALHDLMSVIHNQHPFSQLSMTDFLQKIKPKIERSLTDYLKPKNLKKGL